VLPQELPRLERPPVTLRAFEPRDAGLVVSVADDALIPLVTTVPTSGRVVDALAYLDRQHQRLRAGEGYSFAIAESTTDDAVGQIGLWTRDIDAGRMTTGYWIAPAHRCRGYAGAALAAVTDWALGLDEVARVELYVEPWNEGSWRAAERCGYRREGLLHSWQLVGTERKDMYVYGAVREEASGSPVQV
jgi:RimJ/RimL family protein N-acetyltransferase